LNPNCSPDAPALTPFRSLVELFYARQEQASVTVASVMELCAMVKLCAVSTLSSALNMGARPDQLDDSGTGLGVLFGWGLGVCC